MAAYQLKNDWVVAAAIVAHDAAGDVVPAPDGDTYSVASSNDQSLAVAIGTMSDGRPAVVMNALVQVSPGLSFTLSDSAGLLVDTVDVDIVQDVTPTALGVDLANVEHTMQPVPANPGP